MFVNLKIDIYLQNAVCMEKNKGAFDSLLAMLYFNQQKNEGIFNGDYEQSLPFLKMSECGVYHASFPQFEGIGYYVKEALIKKFDHNVYAKYGVITTAKGASVGRKNDTTAALKNALYSHERVEVKKVTYYVKGDKEIIAKLLKKLNYIGKKSSLGWGKVKRIELEEIEKDFSVQKGGKLMRNLPVKNSFNLKGKKVCLFRLVHPYWKKSGLYECILPE